MHINGLLGRQIPFQAGPLVFGFPEASYNAPTATPASSPIAGPNGPAKPVPNAVPAIVAPPTATYLPACSQFTFPAPETKLISSKLKTFI